MLEVVYGKTRNPTVARQLAEELGQLQLEGTLYLGYPVLASADESTTLDALLVSPEYGAVVFIFGDNAMRGEWQALKDQQDKLYFALTTNLGRHPALRKGRDLGSTVSTVTVFPEPVTVPAGLELCVSGLGELRERIRNLPRTDERFFRPLNAAVQRVTTIKPVKKRLAATTAGSRGSVLKRIEREIANLDQWQKKAAIECPDGPQRIRGLAGSGKTIVLALKAAYLHAQYPEWLISVTFHSRSLYQQFQDLIRRFSYEHTGDEPNWDRLKIEHAWGGSWKGGVYVTMANRCGVNPRDFLYGRTKYGSERAFDGVCQELLEIAEAQNIEPIYDAVLIDEAQDLAASFFRLVYRFTKDPKRIVWAFDELQNLSDVAMPAVADMFGTDRNGQQVVNLSNLGGQPRQDIVLPVCYRNTPWALTLGHSLGFGIYREQGLVQHFDDPSLWVDVGYVLKGGSLELGKRVRLERDPNSTPDYFRELLREPDAVLAKAFDSEVEQAEWVAKEIKKNLADDELERDDILIILPHTPTAKSESRSIMSALTRHGIDSHLAGVTTSQDEIFSKDSIAISHIHRAKGNEAPMVYVLNCQHCVTGQELIRRRNALFTAVTRSRAWIRLCGWGQKMEEFSREMKQLRDNGYVLDFDVPTSEELTHLKKIHRDLTPSEKATMQKAKRGLEEFMKAVQSGEIAPENLPSADREQLERIAQRIKSRKR